MGRKENFFAEGNFAIHLFLILNLIIHGVFGARGGSEYLYKDKEDAVNVFEYIKPDQWNDTKNIPDSFLSLQKENDEPKFLASPDYGDRVIEFYSPWCGHCIHYAPEYMKLATETKKTNPEINFYAVSCAPHRDLCKKFNIRKFPTLLIIKEDSVTAHDLQLTKLKEGTTTVPEQFEKSLDDLKEEKFSSEILASYGMNIRVGVFDGMKATLAEPRRKIFSNWLHLVESNLPEEWQAKQMTSELLENFESLAEDKLNMFGVVDKYSKERPSCYECGLWHLLHVISVGVAEKSENLLAAERQALAKETTSTIVGFLENFFNCDGCKKSFTEVNESCWNGWCNRIDTVDADIAGKEWQSIAVWMWDLHNYYKKEMKKQTDSNEGETSKADATKNTSKTYWPSHEECKECWKDDGDYAWILIYDHLKKTYWREGEKEFKKEAVHSSINLNSIESAQSFLSTITMVCVILLSLIMWCFLRGAVSTPSCFLRRNMHSD